MLARVNLNKMADLGLSHRDFVDQRAPPDRDHGVRQVHRPLCGVVGSALVSTVPLGRMLSHSASGASAGRAAMFSSVG
jgi:hypothetical protein